ncbi:hypothetical protein [Photobacterium leiognathi]|uniref:hypothetical protein n=1 Tax=Photobacterium leiognathi TaxID=553611 RepID=UPI0006B63DAE|nr:hypothetical protein [Photobacterium leiognathi]KPA54551.1 hypothetical protein VT25_01275 [Photobacterium leiognathi subsp. mandapamensis]
MNLHQVPVLTNTQREIIYRRVRKTFCGMTLPSTRFVFAPAFICLPQQTIESYAMKIKSQQGLFLFAIIVVDGKAIQLHETLVSVHGLSRKAVIGFGGQKVDIPVPSFNHHLFTPDRRCFPITVNLSPYADLLTVDHPYIDEWTQETTIESKKNA